MAEKLRLAVLGSTNGSDMQAVIDAIRNKELFAEIVLVVSDRTDAFILERARVNTIPTFVVDYKQFSNRSQAETAIVNELKKSATELVLLIGFMKILTPLFVNEFKGRIWNIHPSLLPKYAKGMDLDIHKVVLENKEKETGCTLHEVTEELDAGRIIMQKSCEVYPNDTPEGLKARVQKLEQECLVTSLKEIATGKLSLPAS